MIDIYNVIFMEIHHELKAIFLIQVFPEDGGTLENCFFSSIGCTSQISIILFCTEEMLRHTKIIKTLIFVKTENNIGKKYH